MGEIRIKGARQHNLKNINLCLPRNQLIVVTGVSGSGKSSLALDTIYAEGQRRYVESLSAYARQFLQLMDKPEVDSIEGLSPAIAIEQKAISKNPRSTVATVTEIYDYLRLLFARVGEVFCYKCNRPIHSQTVQQMCDQILELKEGTNVHILAPIVRGRKGEFEKDFIRLKRQGYTRVQVDGKTYSLDDKIRLDKKRKHSIAVFVDRLVIKSGMRNRLTDSLETAMQLTGGLVAVDILEKTQANKEHGIDKTIIFSENFACPHCGVSYAEISPRLFSFNSPFGACPRCSGLGTQQYFDPNLIVTNAKLSIREGAILPWAHRHTVQFYSMLEAVAQHYGFSLYAPFSKLDKSAKDILFYGVDDKVIPFREELNGRLVAKLINFTGVIPYLEKKLEESRKDPSFSEIERFMGETDCPTCKGKRLKREALFIRINGKNIDEVTSMSIAAALKFFGSLRLDKKSRIISQQIIKEIKDRLTFLKNVGLEYLTLNRKSATLSGGEGQRIRLATQIGSRLVGVLYILDEPSIGLHQRDNIKLITTLKSLRDLGNTVIVVEHDEETIRSADHLVDLGPGAGRNGGEVVAIGSPTAVTGHKRSLTGAYLRGDQCIPVPKARRRVTDSRVTIKEARGNNLKKINVSFPIGLFTCVTGVSGSGKSTLVIDTLYRHLMQRIYNSKKRAAPVLEIDGLKFIDKVVDIDQSPIGRTPRSNPATYTGFFTDIRDLFAMLPEAKARGYRPGRFSFNVKGGRCEACSGDGILKIEMHFLPDVYVKCDACQGKRYNRETLEVTYRGKNIHQVLEMTVNQASEFFKNIPRIRQKLKTLQDVGLGYISLGQPATTLSGGEAQRIKLSKELSKRATGRTLYILDEPTTGLHFEDIRKLLNVIHRLTNNGNTVVVIEHNLDVIKSCDYVIDLGPDGGDKGGYLVAAGSPEEIVSSPRSYTGAFLSRVLHAN